ncbi:MAG: DNA-binding protein [Clostridiales bacterium GWF2_38_85]|nr:MAG: DNA-binding protein [Clostridiales bacterium GWF2_38_85]HBL84659.1 DNA-binding protein [Clostridiales bacterium]
MNYEEHIENALVYIEFNLKTDLNLSDLAKAAGYSEYHFLRVFKEVTHLTPADYIRKRRLSEIVREIDNSYRPISDIAFEYGFNSKENFTRAFKAEHHVLPTEYKAADNSLKLYDRIYLQVPTFEITPKINTIPSFNLTGYWSDENYTPNFWNKYNCKKLSKRLSGGEVCIDYGVCRWNNDTNHLDYFIGIRTEDAKGDITDTKQLHVSGGLYAIFTTPPTSHFDFVNTIHKSWSYILNVWMPKSDYQCAESHGDQFETYVEDSRTFNEDIYIPIEKKRKS